MTVADRAARVAQVTREAAAPVTGRRSWKSRWCRSGDTSGTSTMAAVATVVCVTVLAAGGGTLYVSEGGARPREVARYLVAAAWQ